MSLGKPQRRVRKHQLSRGHKLACHDGIHILIEGSKDDVEAALMSTPVTTDIIPLQVM